MIDYQGESFLNYLKKRIQLEKKTSNPDKLSMGKAIEMMEVSKSTMYQYFKSKNLTVDTVKKILKVFNTTENDVFGNTGDNLTDSVNKDGDKIVQANGRPVDISFGPSNMYVVPVKAYGGFLSGYESSVFMDSLQKAPFPFVKGECFAFEVDGLSMYKDYLPGDWVVATLVENLEWLSKGKVYVFQTVDGIIIKCFERIEGDHLYLKSLNEEYNPVSPIHLKDLKKVYFKEKVIKN